MGAQWSGLLLSLQMLLLLLRAAARIGFEDLVSVAEAQLRQQERLQTRGSIVSEVCVRSVPGEQWVLVDYCNNMHSHDRSVPGEQWVLQDH